MKRAWWMMSKQRVVLRVRQGVELLRALIRKILFLREDEYLRAYVARLEEHNRNLKEHNRNLEEHNRLLTIAATERARELQDREAELTQALAVMSQRVERLSQHNQWLMENAMEAVSELQGLDPETTMQSRVVREIDSKIQGLMTQQQVKEVETRICAPSHQSYASSPNSIGSVLGTELLGGSDRQSQYLPREKHVLMVTSVLARGGCERQMLATADGLIHRGYQIEIFCFGAPPPEGSFIEEFSRLGITCRHAFEAVDSMARVNDGRDVQSLQQLVQLVDHLDVLAIGRALIRAIKDFRPEIVHCFSDFANVVGGFIATDLCVPRVVLMQVNVPAFRDVNGPEPYACRHAYRLLAAKSNVVMLNNSLAGVIAYAKWLDVPNDKIKVLYNGYLSNGIHIRQRSETEACRRELGLVGDMQVVGAVIRFAAEKDPILWLETAAAIAVARPNTHFLLAGYGELAEQVRDGIQSLGLAERFVLAGQTRDVGLIYGTLDVFLMTSRFEGVPNVLIEAQAAGIPVVTPNVGGTRETLLDGTTGIVVGNRRPLSLASAVLQILDDSSWRERTAIEGPAFVSKRFGYQRMIDETIAAYDLRI